MVLVVQQPTIRVGIIPNGLTAEVFVAPQPSAIKKAKAQGKAKTEVTEEDRPRLELIADAATRSFDDLKAEFGQALRIAVDPEEIFAAITGSHVKFIARGREIGITVVELGRNTKYDQKSCFYLVKQLIELNLIVKVRRGGVGTHLCLHKHFYDTSPRWREVREEESKAQQLFHGAPEPDDAGDMAEEVAPQTLANLGFTPIDARHLSSLPLIQARSSKGLRREDDKVLPLVTPGSSPTPSGAAAASIDDGEETNLVSLFGIRPSGIRSLRSLGRVYRLRTNTTLHKQW
ncbi:Transcription factor tau [Salix suchowensis]|nr:Transcription factor tau [Salix suchowensis]